VHNASFAPPFLPTHLTPPPRVHEFQVPRTGLWDLSCTPLHECASLQAGGSVIATEHAKLDEESNKERKAPDHLYACPPARDGSLSCREPQDFQDRMMCIVSPDLGGLYQDQRSLLLPTENFDEHVCWQALLEQGNSGGAPGIGEAMETDPPNAPPGSSKPHAAQMTGAEGLLVPLDVADKLRRGGPRGCGNGSSNNSGAGGVFF
jgi:hypothetical protein